MPRMTLIICISSLCLNEKILYLYKEESNLLRIYLIYLTVREKGKRDVNEFNNLSKWHVINFIKCYKFHFISKIKYYTKLL